ncbi:MAG: hypothetical protein ACUVRZ_08430, partial [Desulfobacca sp.]
MAPLVSLLTGNTFHLESRLAVSGGSPRALWMLCCIVVGMLSFFLAYMHTRPRQVTFGLPDNNLPPGTWVIMTLALGAAAYTILMFRVSGAAGRELLLIQQGKFTGEVIGYQYVSH